MIVHPNFDRPCRPERRTRCYRRRACGPLRADMNRGFVLPLLAAENESSHAAITAWGVSHFLAAPRRSGSHLGQPHVARGRPTLPLGPNDGADVDLVGGLERDLPTLHSGSNVVIGRQLTRGVSRGERDLELTPERIEAITLDRIEHRNEGLAPGQARIRDRKSTRLNSSHVA